MSKETMQRLLIIAGIAIVILLGVTIFLVVNSYQQGEKLTQQNVELNEAKQLADELELEYETALEELEQYKGENEELNMLIEQQQEEITLQKDKIASLIRDGKDLKEARRQINRLVAQRDEYLAEVQRLKEENELLAAENEQLNMEKMTLTDSLNTRKSQNEELASAKAALVSEKEQLESQNDQLARKVNIASVVKVENVEIVPEMIKKSGKVKEKKKAEKVDRIRICFEAIANKVADQGTEKFFIRIISPQGTTIAIEDLGSGVMTNNASQEKIRFTKVKEVEYANDNLDACTIWEQSNPMTEGIYEVEIYNKGYLAGTGSFKLK